MIAVPPPSTSGDSWCSCGVYESGRDGDATLIGSRLDLSCFEPLASLNSRARYVSVDSFDAQSLCCAMTGETCCTLSFDTDANSGDITGD